MSIPIKSIVKYIKLVYKPYDIVISDYDNSYPPRFKLKLYFDKIDEKYFLHKHAKSRINNKKHNFEMEIRGEISLIFSVTTIGETLVDDRFTYFNAYGQLYIEVETDERDN